jgi:hypothetical protein
LTLGKGASGQEGMAGVELKEIPENPPRFTVNRQKFRAGIFKQSMGARNREGIGLLYRPARLHRLAELISWNRFLGSLKV